MNSNSPDEKILRKLSRLCREMAHGDYGRAEELYELTKTGRYPELLSTLAESFGMMSVQVAAREFRLEGMIADLEEARSQLEDYSRGLEETVARRTAEIRDKNEALESANRRLQEKQRRLDEDLRAASQIQRSLLPPRPPDCERFAFAWCFEPCERIGGDIFSIQRLDASHLGIYLLDVMGHGVRSAMVTVSVHQSLLPQSGTILSASAGSPLGSDIRPPDEVLGMLDREYPMERFGGFFTMNYMVLDLLSGWLDYANAGHPRPILLHADGSWRLLEAGGSIIGLGGIVPFEHRRTHLQPGDRLYLYTDGIVEQPDADGLPYGQERLCDRIAACRDVDLEASCRQVAADVRAYAGEQRPEDDITLFGLEHCG